MVNVIQNQTDYLVHTCDIHIIWLINEFLYGFNYAIDELISHFMKNGILFPNVFWPTLRKKCSSDPETVKGQNIFLNRMFFLKFGLSEKHSKFWKNLPHGFDKSADLLSKRQNHEEDFFKICVLPRKSKL